MRRNQVAETRWLRAGVPGARRVYSRHLAVIQMFMVFRCLALALVFAALGSGVRMAHAQAAAVPYWMADMPIGFGGILSSDENSNGTFRYKFSNGLFIGGGRSDF